MEDIHVVTLQSGHGLCTVLDTAVTMGIVIVPQFIMLLSVLMLVRKLLVVSTLCVIRGVTFTLARKVEPIVRQVIGTQWLLEHAVIVLDVMQVLVSVLLLAYIFVVLLLKGRALFR